MAVAIVPTLKQKSIDSELLLVAMGKKLNTRVLRNRISKSRYKVFLRKPTCYLSM